MARRLNRSPSTISRELRRNASTRTYPPVYKPSTAQWHAERRARRPKAAKMATNERLRDYVQERLWGQVKAPDGRAVAPPGPKWNGKGKPHRADRRWVKGWSPEQIAKRLPVDFPDDETMGISPRRSAGPSTSKGEGRSNANSSPACGLGGHSGSHGRGPARSPGRT